MRTPGISLIYTLALLFLHMALMGLKHINTSPNFNGCQSSNRTSSEVVLHLVSTNTYCVKCVAFDFQIFVPTPILIIELNTIFVFITLSILEFYIRVVSGL